MANLTVIQSGGDYIVHAAGCRDIKKDTRNPTEIYSYDVQSWHNLGAELWGEIASDDFHQGTPPWWEKVEECMSISTTVRPCVKFKEEK